MTSGMGRLSLNQKTTELWSVAEAADGCARAGIGWIGLWREQVRAAGGAEEAGRMVREAGLRVSSYCRGGFFTADSAEGWRRAVEDNRRTVEEAAAAGGEVVVLVCGGIRGEGLEASRRQVEEGIAAVVPTAEAAGVRLAIEPLHPMFCADRSVIVSLRQALDIAEHFPADAVGVAVDAFHLWWDPEVWGQIERAAERIFSYQVCDWLDPLPDVLLGRGMMGDGVIDFTRLTKAVAATGYAGPVEVEIFNREIWNQPGDQVLTTMKERYNTLVAPHL